VRPITRLLATPLRATTLLVTELLRVEAAALTELGRLAESLGAIIRENIETERTSEVGRPSERSSRPSLRPVQMPSQAETPRTEAPQTPPPRTSPPPAPGSPAAPPSLEPHEARDAPAHVDEEAVLVAESADSGAQEGAGATVHVQEPWHGYRSMRAREIVDHLPAVADEVLSLVLLYEPKAGRSRPTVIRAAERELSRRAA
jgi:hypothetical protein